MAIFPLVRQEELDVERRQGCFIELQRAFDIGYSQDDVVDHFSFLQIARVSMECLPSTNDFINPCLQRGWQPEIPHWRSDNQKVR